MINRSILAAAVAALTFAGAAQASVTIALTGKVADFSYSQMDWSGLHFDEYYLPLSGLDASNAFTVGVGDTINTTVTFDKAYTMPASAFRTDFLLFLTSSSFPTFPPGEEYKADTGVHGTINLFNGGTQVLNLQYWSSTSGELASFGLLDKGLNTAYAFDSFTVETTIDKLEQPVTFDGAGLEYALVSKGVAAVPEPAVWAMLLFGFGAMGLALRLKDRRGVAAA